MSRIRIAGCLLIAGGLICARLGVAQPTPPLAVAQQVPDTPPVVTPPAPLAPTVPAPPPLPARTSLLDDSLDGLPAVKPLPPVVPLPTQGDVAVVRVGATSKKTLAAASTLAVEVVGPATVSADEPLVFDMVVCNLGTTPLNRVRVEQELPAGARLRSANPAPEVQGDHVAWVLGTLDGQAERRIHIEMLPGTQSEVVLSPSVTFSPAVGLRTKMAASMPAVAPVPEGSALVVSQKAPNAAQIGTKATIQIQVANRGTSPISNVVLQDQLPVGLDHPKGKLIAADLGILAPGEVRTLQLEVAATQAGPQANEAAALIDGKPVAVSRATILVGEPSPAAPPSPSPLGVKIAAPDTVPIVRETELHLEVTNAGPTPAMNVRLTQSVPEGFQILGSQPVGAFDWETRRATWSFSMLRPGEKQSVTLKVRPNLAGTWQWESVLTADSMPEARQGCSINVEGAARP